MENRVMNNQTDKLVILNENELAVVKQEVLSVDPTTFELTCNTTLKNGLIVTTLNDIFGQFIDIESVTLNKEIEFADGTNPLLFNAYFQDNFNNTYFDGIMLNAGMSALDKAGIQLAETVDTSESAIGEIYLKENNITAVADNDHYTEWLIDQLEKVEKYIETMKLHNKRYELSDDQKREMNINTTDKIIGRHGSKANAVLLDRYILNTFAKQAIETAETLADTLTKLIEKNIVLPAQEC